MSSMLATKYQRYGYVHMQPFLPGKVKLKYHSFFSSVKCLKLNIEDHDILCKNIILGKERKILIILNRNIGKLKNRINFKSFEH